MKTKIAFLNHFVIVLVLLFFETCISQEDNIILVEEIKKSDTIKVAESKYQIGDYVVETFEDSKGNLWFGTLARGVAKYDGKVLKYLTKKNGLPSNRIVSIVEDSVGNLWFGTDEGISKYDGKKFTTFSDKNGLINNLISFLFIDSKGIFWIGTWGGVSQFDGTNFENFEIPYPKIDSEPNKDSKDWITSILEDAKGNIWFGRDGYGASKFDGSSFTHITKGEGLYSNNVQTLSEDNDGNLWIGTRVSEKDNPDPNKRIGKGGLDKYDGNKIIHFPTIKGLNENDVYKIYKDNDGTMWISTINNGIYEYNNNKFKNHKIPKAIVRILKDRNDNIWLGCAGGLFRINSKGISNMTTNEPWN